MHLLYLELPEYLFLRLLIRVVLYLKIFWISILLVFYATFIIYDMLKLDFTWTDKQEVPGSLTVCYLVYPEVSCTICTVITKIADILFLFYQKFSSLPLLLLDCGTRRFNEIAGNTWFEVVNLVHLKLLPLMIHILQIFF